MLKTIAQIILKLLFTFMGYSGTALANSQYLETSLTPLVESLAIAIKPIGYALLAVFALIEFTQLAEKMGNINGFAGTGLVIEVLIKLLLCKLVVDNSTEICHFIVGLTDVIAQAVTAPSNINIATSAQIDAFLDEAFPAWYEPISQMSMIAIILVFAILTILCMAVVYIIYYARIVELYVYTAISPIPLSTCLSKSFNIAPNYIKNLFAVGLQGTLIVLVVRIFNILTMRELSAVVQGNTPTRSIISFIFTGSGSQFSCIHLLISTLFLSLLLLVCAMQTQRWAKSISHAM